MDINWIKKQKEELDRLFEGSDIHKYGRMLTNQQLSAPSNDCGTFCDISRTKPNIKKLQEEVEKLRAENKTLKQKLAMQFLEYKGACK